MRQVLFWIVLLFFLLAISQYERVKNLNKDMVTDAMPNYVAKEGYFYYYISGLNRKKPSPDDESDETFSFIYLGINENGHHMIIGDGDTFACKEPCEIIEGVDRGRFVYNKESPIGQAFQDAINGHLKVQKPKRKPIV